MNFAIGVFIQPLLWVEGCMNSLIAYFAQGKTAWKVKKILRKFL